MNQLERSPFTSLSRATIDVLTERTRQVMAEGYTPEHDDHHRNGELAQAAVCHALQAVGMVARRYWPWERDGWVKPAPPRQDLVKAAALLLAELERRDRAQAALDFQRSPKAHP
jgi:hypothetical protein